MIHPFQKVFELIEPAFPEAGHLAGPVDQRGEGAAVGAVVGEAAVLAVAHQAGLFQNPKVLGNGGLRDAGLGRQGTDRLFALAAQPLENGPPGWVGEGSKEEVGGVRHHNQ
ncbi:MAG: hypothetical protein BGP04_03680 [Rhizobiales bacterium 62-17]|nr:MAG: hypothetical protein BGP04_03680 [Rhizobiales bacterium 62-17]